jgi:hypothetical protein
MKRTISVNFPFTLLLFVALVTVAAGSWWVSRVAFTQQLHDFRDNRFHYSINRIRSGLEYGLKLGFVTADIPGAQALIDDVKSQDTTILSIDVFDASGRTLFTTDLGGVGDGLRAQFRKTCLSGKASAVLHDYDDDGSLACTALVNSFQSVSGGIVMRNRMTLREGNNDLPDQWQTLVLLLMLVTLTGCAAGWLVIRSTEHQFKKIANALAGDSAADPPVGDDELVGPVASAMHKLEQIHAELCAVEVETQRIDRLESQ